MAEEITENESGENPKRERSPAQLEQIARNLKIMQESKSLGRPKIGLVEPPNDGAPEELQVMRHVYLNPKRLDQTQPQKLARDIRDKSPDRFLALKAQMEREFEEKKNSAEQGELALVGSDGGSERSMELCRSALGEIAERVKE